MKRIALHHVTGVSLVEILIGIVIVTIASIATLSYFAYARGSIGKQGHRRAALERARQRLDEVMTASITSVQPPFGSVWWITTCSGNPFSCAHAITQTTQPVSVDNLPAQPSETTVQCQKDPAVTGEPATTCDTLAVDVRVWFTGNTDPVNDDNNFNRVYIRTLRTS